MIHAHTRLWLYPVPKSERLEVIILGDLELLAHSFAILKGSAERWPGFQQVTLIVQGPTAIGFRVNLSPNAAHTDQVAEGMRWLREELPIMFRRMRWSVEASEAGAVATW